MAGDEAFAGCPEAQGRYHGRAVIANHLQLASGAWPVGVWRMAGTSRLLRGRSRLASQRAVTSFLGPDGSQRLPGHGLGAARRAQANDDRSPPMVRWSGGRKANLHIAPARRAGGQQNRLRPYGRRRVSKISGTRVTATMSLRGAQRRSNLPRARLRRLVRQWIASSRHASLAVLAMTYWGCVALP
jgi:hypothetical protein